jgi:dolichyl-phosphate beta-glucosyltransferase
LKRFRFYFVILLPFWLFSSSTLKGFYAYSMLPPFSVVIPCFNEAARIGETLRLTLDYLTANAPESELIVVNDGSTDSTAAIARERLKDARIETRLLENFPNRGKGAAVRSGLLAAQKPIGQFFDADLSTPL